MNARRAKRKARLARKRARLNSPRSLSDILKRLYPQARYYELAYPGTRLLGGKFKCRYNPANRERKYAEHALAAWLGFDA